jgi:hypothetical protein
MSIHVVGFKHLRSISAIVSRSPARKHSAYLRVACRLLASTSWIELVIPTYELRERVLALSFSTNPAQSGRNIPRINDFSGGLALHACNVGAWKERLALQQQGRSMGISSVLDRNTDRPVLARRRRMGTDPFPRLADLALIFRSLLVRIQRRKNATD